ncbi:hypothetical protein CIY_19960 [Butyrivibrio fibrisolvens 16/4]|nr:hypothetical protein CIY_19960 [Butyrivibrio fibrisolvens 16/4]
MARNEEIKDSKVALVAHIVSSVVFLALGICLLTLDANMISTIVYSFSVLAVGILFIAFGAWYMIKYFFNHEYNRISNYGFTMGVILVIIGAIFIFQANYISAFIDSLVCLIGIVLGAVMLQQSFALFHIERGTWFLSLIFGIATVGASIYFLITPHKFFERNILTCSFMIAVGGLSLFSLLLMAIGLRDHRKDSNRNYNRNVADAPSSLDDSIFEEEPESEMYSSDYADTSSDSLFED